MEQIKNKELWGSDLFNAFSDHINEDGWLTADWAKILEDNFSNWDKNYNDTNEKKDLYSLMYNLDYEENEDGTLIRPIVESDDQVKEEPANDDWVNGDDLKMNGFDKQVKEEEPKAKKAYDRFADKWVTYYHVGENNEALNKDKTQVLGVIGRDLLESKPIPVQPQEQTAEGIELLRATHPQYAGLKYLNDTVLVTHALKAMDSQLA